MTALTPLQNAFLPAAYRDRRVVAEFAQDSAAEIKTYPAGFCAGLAVHWLARRSGGKNWPSPQDGADAKALSAAAAVTYGKYLGATAKANQMNEFAIIARVVGNSLGGIDAPDIAQSKTVLKDILGSLGMSLDEDAEPRIWRGGAGKQFIHEVAVLGAGYYYINMKCAQGSHALGLQIASTKLDSACEFFDPNLGQFHYENPSQFSWAFSGLLVNNYLPILKYDFTSGFAMRVMPPQLK